MRDPIEWLFVAAFVGMAGAGFACGYMRGLHEAPPCPSCPECVFGQAECQAYAKREWDAFASKYPDEAVNIRSQQACEYENPSYVPDETKRAAASCAADQHDLWQATECCERLSDPRRHLIPRPSWCPPQIVPPTTHVDLRIDGFVLPDGGSYYGLDCDDGKSAHVFGAEPKELQDKVAECARRARVGKATP